jgi:hypothetical protein
MVGEYRLAAVKNSICYFSVVSVNVEIQKKRSSITESINSANSSLGEVNSNDYPEWVSAALDGVEDTIKYIEMRKNRYYSVEIIKIIGIQVDTTIDAVKTSATLATWKAIRMISPELELQDVKPVFIQRNWFASFLVD